MTFITSDPTAPYRHALNAWVSPLATCALPKGVCYLLTYYLRSAIRLPPAGQSISLTMNTPSSGKQVSC